MSHGKNLKKCSCSLKLCLRPTYFPLLTPENLCNFYHELRLEIVFPALKLSQNYLCLKDSHHNWTKCEIKETSKIPISQLFSEFGKIWKYSLS